MVMHDGMTMIVFVHFLIFIEYSDLYTSKVRYLLPTVPNEKEVIT